MGSAVSQRYRDSIPVSPDIRTQAIMAMKEKKESKESTDSQPESITLENKSGLTPGGDSQSRRISACCLHELKLMDIGPLPYDHTLIEEERQREIEKKLKNDI